MIKVMLRRILPYLIGVLALLLLILSFLIGSFLNYKKILKIFPDNQVTRVETGDKYTRFFFEVYDMIRANYWNKMSDEQIDNLVKLAVEKLIGLPLPKTANDRQSLEKTLIQTTKNMTEDQKKEFYPRLVDLVLQNLEPFGRSRLYSAKETKDLSNTINNIEPGSDRYADLGVGKTANKQEIDTAYSKKMEELNKQPDSAEKTSKIAVVEKAYSTLKDEGSKKNYDEKGMDPSATYKIYGNRVLYVNLTKFTPTSVQDVVRAAENNAGNANLDTMIIDVRGNIGGLIDGLPYLLGPFIGNDQYAYQFFNQGNKIDYKTKIGFIPSFFKYNKVIVLIDGQSQSSAEVFAASLKKYNVGVVVGNKTKGWGTVEKVTKLTNQIKDDETYSVMLVENLTLKEDGTPIEGTGVSPDIDISDPAWDSKLKQIYNFQDIIDAVKQVLVKS